jgi:hypothetical protein
VVIVEPTVTVAGKADNRINADITINSAGELNVGGINLVTLGVQPLDAQTVQLVKTINTARLLVQGNAINVDFQGKPALQMDWNANSRKVVTDLAANLGYGLKPEVMARIEEWITTSTVEATARYANEASKPVSINLTKALWVDLTNDGHVSVEQFPLDVELDAATMATIKQAGISNSTVCWNKGNLTMRAGGKPLPGLTLLPKGVELAGRMLGPGSEKGFEVLLNSLLGADISLGGAPHQPNATCQ